MTADDLENFTNVAQTCFDKLISYLSTLPPSINKKMHIFTGEHTQLMTGLQCGLLTVIHEKVSSDIEMHPYVRSEVSKLSSVAGER